jgi:hypothetical protein
MCACVPHLLSEVCMMRDEFKCGRLAQVRVIVGEVDDKLNSKAYIVSNPMLCLSTSLTLFLSRSRMHAFWNSPSFRGGVKYTCLKTSLESWMGLCPPPCTLLHFFFPPPFTLTTRTHTRTRSHAHTQCLTGTRPGRLWRSFFRNRLIG